MDRSAPTEVCDISRNCASVNSPAPGTSRSMTYLGMSILRKLCHASMHVRPLQECRAPVEPEVAARVRETCVGNEGIMDIRSLQKPLKEQYRSDPNASRITIRAKGGQTDVPIACSVDIGRAIYQAEAHPGVGGGGDACSGALLLGALAACAQITCQ